MKKNSNTTNISNPIKDVKEDKDDASLASENDICKRIEKFLEDADSNDDKEKIVTENFID